MAQFAVIGLGRFGSTASLELIRLGHQVLGVDSEPKFINRLADKLSYAVIADATDEQALAELDLLRYDAVLVAIGEDLEASILCVLHLKNLGVQQLWVKASSKPHHTILSRLGVSRIIHPEEEMGIKVAQALNYPMINQYLSLGHNHYLVEILVNNHLEGTVLSTLLKDTKQDVKTVLVKRHSKLLSPVPDDFILETNDCLILAGTLSMLESLAPRLV
ncbi:potassium channel family protein [Serratia oryzae]|jgi:trk system potassium uptake protein TrkA|uniref:Potassium transporter TrkA n=1 Tax=Serratia oryzae TaxID=2034155 RepID=A0A1S8CEG2_9GAMM|nr:TrkA family potassium uptake protein [Serratia oryzae]OMQ19952.1 potassium transporter TrkA [Serratia oryzae]VXC98536.1 Ktr system potassium uptake protein A [Enterobacterales bacterium 8AC]